MGRDGFETPFRDRLYSVPRGRTVGGVRYLLVIKRI